MRTNTTSTQKITPCIVESEDNYEEFFIHELAGFLSERGNEHGTLEYDIIRDWVYQDLTDKGIKDFYQKPYLSSNLNKILLKITLLPDDLLQHIAKKYVPPTQLADYMRALQTIQNQLIVDFKQQQPFACFIKMPQATKIKEKQLARLKKDYSLALHLSDEKLDGIYETKWQKLTSLKAGSPENTTRNASPVNFLHYRLTYSLSPISAFQELNLFSNRSSSITPINVPDSPTLTTPN